MSAHKVALLLPARAAIATPASKLIIDAASAVADAASATIISSATTVPFSPDVSTTDGRWPPSLVAAGAISISAIVAFSSTSTAAVVTNLLLQLSKVSLTAARST